MEEEQTEINTVNGGYNHVNHSLQSNHCYANSVRFNRRPGQTLNMYRKPNHSRASESWRGVKNNGAPNWKIRPNCTGKGILPTLPSEEENDSSPKSPKLLLRQLSVDINTDSKTSGRDSSPEEKSSSEPFSDPSLEWDQENLMFKADTHLLSPNKDDDESFEMTHLNKDTSMTVLQEMADEEEHDECDELLTEHNSSENGSSDSHSLDSDTPVLAKKESTDFSRHLYLFCGQDLVDNPSPYPNGALDDISENPNKDNLVGIEENEDTLRRFYDDVEDMPRRLYEDVDHLGYTEFDTMNDVSSRAHFVSSPTPSSLHKSPVQSIPTSPIASTHGSSRSGFSELPFRNCLTDTLRLSEPDSPYGSPREIESGYTSGIPRDNRKKSTGSSKNSGRLLLQEQPDSPQSKYPGISAELRYGGSPGGSLKDGYADKRNRKGGLRRTLTEFNSPSDSCGSLNEKPMASSRRRKVSAAIQPPIIFAPLVANVTNPYKDFVPPVRESAITCDCQSADHVPGMSCNNYLERKSDDLDSDNEINSEDQTEDFYKNMENLFAENQLQCSNISGSNHRFQEVEEYSSKMTATSETSFENHDLRSDPSQKIDDSSIDFSSIKELDDYFTQPFSSYSGLQRPSISGAYSTHCIEKDEIPETDELGQLFRPIKTSFSEPHLNLMLPVLPGSNGSTDQGLSRVEDEGSFISEDTTTRNLEDIFKDVSSTREAIEKLESILKSPEPEILTDLADTKLTVQNLDRQVLNLNKEVASLSSDVRTILELLRGLKSGQVVF